MKVFVLGASGFLGGRVVSRLIARGHDVSGLARSATAATRITALGAEAVHGDLEDPSSFGRALEGSKPDALLTSVPFSAGYGPGIVTAAEEAHTGRGVFVSTTSIFTKLDTASKPLRLNAEDRIRSSTLEWTIVRPTMIYGAPEDRNMARLLRLLAKSPVVPLPGGGSGLQQPVHVDDLAAAIVTALEDPIAIRKTYELAGPEALTFRQVIEQASAAMGKRVVTFPLPLGPVVALARLYERMAPRARFRAEQFERLAEDKAFDITAARAELGFAPRTFATGIADEARALRKTP